MRTKVPEHPAELAHRYPKVWAAFEKLGSACHDAGPLDARTRRLVKLGIAIGAGSEGAVHAQVRNALAEGIPPEGLRHVVLLGLTTLGFPAAMAAMSWMEDLLPRRARRRRRR